MMVTPDAPPRGGGATEPPAFREAVKGLHAARLRPEVFCEEMPAPQRIAPHAAALSADVSVDGEELGTGRIIVLHDPDGNDAWAGTFRCVAYVRAEVDLELVTDPLLGEVGWTWLTEALDAHGAAYAAPSGTVTRVATEAFGGMSDDEATAQVEVRASWTPVAAGEGSEGAAPVGGPRSAADPGPVPDLRPHVEAWGELLCTAAGLPPVPEGVTPMPSRRGQRGTSGT